MTLNSGGFYEVRGALYGGVASCADPSGVDIYSRFDNLLPLVRQYLTPGNNPGNTVVAVEFYNRALQHYFISTAPAEINDLDTGVHAGWERTGFRFLAYATQTPGTSPVCRFYRAPAFGDSHFYSASPTECASTASQHPLDWVYESPAVFYIPLPDKASGACPANTHPVYRFFNSATTNHRFTAEVDDRDCMISGIPDPDGADPTCRHPGSGWIQEGYGSPPNQVVFCSPNG